MPTTDDLLAVLGRSLDSPRVQRLAEEDDLKELEEEQGSGDGPRVHFLAYTRGYAFIVEASRVVAVFLYAQPADGFAQFAEALPGGLPNSATRADVRQRFGEAESSGGAGWIGTRRYGPWDRYAVSGQWIHFQFSDMDTIELVTIQVDEVDA